ncbi:MAG TPA: hypothetical protein VH877_09760 [Polyangia bacterium]|nr:hypothetical protein [Polyangia bacterium]
MPKVTFVNEQVTVEAKPGENLLEVCERNEINVFRGLFQGFHCGSAKGWCNRCKVWATPLQPGAVNERTGAEKRRLRLNGVIPLHGTMRLACQVVVQGDVEVRTRSGFEVKPNAEWQPDPRPFKWKERWERRNDEPDEEEGKKKPAAAKAKASAAATTPVAKEADVASAGPVALTSDAATDDASSEKAAGGGAAGEA